MRWRICDTEESETTRSLLIACRAQSIHRVVDRVAFVEKEAEAKQHITAWILIFFVLGD